MLERMRVLRLNNPIEPRFDYLTSLFATDVWSHDGDGGHAELRRGAFVIACEVKNEDVTAIELRVPAHMADVPVADRLALARSLVSLAFGYSMSFADAGADLPDLMDELAVHEWLSLPPPPTAAEAHDEVLNQLARGDSVDRELVARALDDPRADELIATLAARAPAAEFVPIGTRDRALLARVSNQFNAYELVGPIGGYANRAKRRFRESGAVPRTAAAARLCLFFEHRRRVHTATDPSDADWRYTDALLEVVQRGERRPY